MNSNRRQILAGLAAAPLAGFVPHQVSAQSGAINYWHHMTSTTEFKGLERVMALFKQKYPAIAVTQENIPNPEYMSKMTNAVVANSGHCIDMEQPAAFAALVTSFVNS